jgi:hypothetical protein
MDSLSIFTKTPVPSSAMCAVSSIGRDPTFSAVTSIPRKSGNSWTMTSTLGLARLRKERCVEWRLKDAAHMIFVLNKKGFPEIALRS